MLDRRAGDVGAEIRTLCTEYAVPTIVVGLPHSLAGEEGAAAEKARALGDEVGRATGCDIVFYDERFTTVQAESVLLEGGMRRRKRRETVDKVAAAMMLQGYLDAGSRDDA